MPIIQINAISRDIYIPLAFNSTSAQKFISGTKKLRFGISFFHYQIIYILSNNYYNYNEKIVGY